MSIQLLTEQIRALGVALKERDVNTAGHSDRTSAIAVELGQACKLMSRELALLRVAGSAHDIGKIGIPDQVLMKPGGLDAKEWALMQSHSLRGHTILMSIDVDGADELADIVLHHHESYDGKGYPQGLAGEAIPALSRILTIADSYDAMATTRPYHRQKSHSEIMDIMFGENATKFDPAIRKIFAEKMEHSPLRVV